MLRGDDPFERQLNAEIDELRKQNYAFKSQPGLREEEKQPDIAQMEAQRNSYIAHFSAQADLSSEIEALRTQNEELRVDLANHTLKPAVAQQTSGTTAPGFSKNTMSKQASRELIKQLSEVLILAIDIQAFLHQSSARLTERSQGIHLC